MTYSVALPLAVNVQDYFREDWSGHRNPRHKQWSLTNHFDAACCRSSRSRRTACTASRSSRRPFLRRLPSKSSHVARRAMCPWSVCPLTAAPSTSLTPNSSRRSSRHFKRQTSSSSCIVTDLQRCKVRSTSLHHALQANSPFAPDPLRLVLTYASIEERAFSTRRLSSW